VLVPANAFLTRPAPHGISLQAPLTPPGPWNNVARGGAGLACFFAAATRFGDSPNNSLTLDARLKVPVMLFSIALIVNAAVARVDHLERIVRRSARRILRHAPHAPASR
jgi:hypothetical protein